MSREESDTLLVGPCSCGDREKHRGPIRVVTAHFAGGDSHLIRHVTKILKRAADTQSGQSASYPSPVAVLHPRC